MAPPQTKTPDAELVLEPIIRAARECFERYGVERTRMGDVAEHAGMARQTLYRYVGSREELLELALGARISELERSYVERFDPDAGPLEEAILNALVVPIEITRADAEFGRLAEALTRRPLARTLSEAGSPSHRVAIAYFTPVLRRARAEGRLRQDVEEAEIIDWMLDALVTTTAREDLSIDRIRETFGKFMIPAILIDGVTPA